MMSREEVEEIIEEGGADLTIAVAELELMRRVVACFADLSRMQTRLWDCFVQDQDELSRMEIVREVTDECERVEVTLRELTLRREMDWSALLAVHGVKSAADGVRLRVEFVRGFDVAMWARRERKSISSKAGGEVANQME